MLSETDPGSGPSVPGSGPSAWLMHGIPIFVGVATLLALGLPLVPIFMGSGDQRPAKIVEENKTARARMGSTVLGTDLGPMAYTGISWPVPAVSTRPWHSQPPEADPAQAERIILLEGSGSLDLALPSRVARELLAKIPNSQNKQDAWLQDRIKWLVLLQRLGAHAEVADVNFIVEKVDVQERLRRSQNPDLPYEMEVETTYWLRTDKDDWRQSRDKRSFVIKEGLGLVQKTVAELYDLVDIVLFHPARGAGEAAGHCKLDGGVHWSAGPFLTTAGRTAAFVLSVPIPTHGPCIEFAGGDTVTGQARVGVQVKRTVTHPEPLAFLVEEGRRFLGGTSRGHGGLRNVNLTVVVEGDPKDVLVDLEQAEACLFNLATGRGETQLQPTARSNRRVEFQAVAVPDLLVVYFGLGGASPCTSAAE